MKPLSLLLFAILLTGCSDGADPAAIDAPIRKEWIDKDRLSIITVGRCEYLTYGYGFNNGLMAHKGDCSNPIHCTCDTLR